MPHIQEKNITPPYLESKNSLVKTEDIDPEISFLDSEVDNFTCAPKDDELLRKAKQSVLKNEPKDNIVHATDLDVVPPPTKRRRLVLDYIFVPPRVTGPSKLVPKSKKLAVKKEKAKKEECTLPQSSVDARLKGIDPYFVPDEICVDTRVSREFMTEKWGGNTQDTFPAIGKANLLRHGLRDFMYLNRLYNPLCPRDHGATGLFFELRSIRERDWGGPKRLFVRHGAKQWQYMGQYDHLPTPDLSQAEWLSMDEPVKAHWARQIHEKVWGRECRASVFLRLRNKRKATREEMKAALSSKEDFKDSVTQQDIRAALDNGEEVIEVWAMKPVGYDLVFAQQVHDLWQNWTPPPKSVKSASTKPKKTDSKKSKSKKRKRSEWEDETEEEREYNALSDVSEEY